MIKFKLFNLICITGLSLFTACTQSGTTSVPADSKSVFDLSVAKKEIDSANQTFAEILSKGDSVSLANMYSTDAEMLPPNQTAVVGRKDIQTEITNLINSGASKLVLTTTNVWGTEDLLAEQGVLTLANKDGKLLDKGKYIVLWKKEDGKWKLFRDLFNSDLPLTPGK